ncbi:MAG TPA: LPS export ABC transporter periplasmic protein LptC [Rudaea sp.]|nr:LPS export ABC transporter periplasmic protein LptC [Rudaea sp.]
MERQLILTLLGLAILAIVTQILVWILVPREQPPMFSGPPRSDYTLTDFSLNALDSQGKKSFAVVAPHLARKAENGSIYVDVPHYEMFDKSSNVWKGTSDSAWVNRDGTVMKLEGKVYMHRIPGEKVTPVTLETTDLTITTLAQEKSAAKSSPAEKMMQTDALATISVPGTVAHGIGMKADMQLKTLDFLSDFHSITQASKLR